jgi:hypothetical protein
MQPQQQQEPSLRERLPLDWPSPAQVGEHKYETH